MTESKTRTVIEEVADGDDRVHIVVEVTDTEALCGYPKPTGIKLAYIEPTDRVCPNCQALWDAMQ